MKLSGVILSVFIFLSAAASIASNRVPRIFTGNSPAPEYANYAPYRTASDSRSSQNYAEYTLNLELLNQVRQSEGIWAVHTHVRNIAVDGLCGDHSECFRVYVFVNGDEAGGSHIATFAVSPGTGYSTPLVSDKKLRRYTRHLYNFEAPTQYRRYDMYRIYGSKSYPDPVPNMPNAMFYQSAIALHGSFFKVNGTKQSHGCIRMFPDESYWLHSLVKEAEGQLTVDVLHTQD